MSVSVSCPVFVSVSVLNRNLTTTSV